METFVKILGIFALAIIMALVMALPTMLLWNAVMPDIFGLIEISFIQALCLNFLANIFFTGKITATSNEA